VFGCCYVYVINLVHVI